MQANEMKLNWQIKFDSLYEFSAPDYSDEQISSLLTNAQLRVFLSRYNPFGNKYGKGFESNEQRRRDLEQLIRSGSISGTGTTGAIQYTGNTTTSSKVIAGLSSIVGLNIGLAISGSGIPSNTTITGILSPTSIEISNNASVTATGVALTSGLGKSKYQEGIHPNGVLLDLPDGFLYATEETLVMSGNSFETMVKPVTHDEYSININNPYKKPYDHLAWRMDVSRHEHAKDELTVATNKRTELILPASKTLVSYRVKYLSMPPAIVCDELDEYNQKHCILDESIHQDIVDEAVSMAYAAVKKEEYQVGLNEAQRSE